MLSRVVLEDVSAPTPSSAQPDVLRVDDLHVEFSTARGVVRAVDGVSYTVRRGEIVALVGESGCGKSVSSLAIMRLLAEPVGRITSGSIVFDGRDLLCLPEAQMRGIRGRDISMIFQEPMTSLNPVLSIETQLTEPLVAHLGMHQSEAHKRAIELLGMVGITDAERRLRQYPHQLSGGMRQRVMIAMGLACNPKLIIADEPTTALDVTIQAQILELMKDLSRRLHIALVIITHNLGLVARYADRVNIMYGGKIVEQGDALNVFTRSRHPYTLGLMRSVPRLDLPRVGKLATIEGLPPNLLNPPPGCRFAPRCEFRTDLCGNPPDLVEVERAHHARCFRTHELAGLTSKTAVAAPAAAAAPAGTPLLKVRDLSKHFAIRQTEVSVLSRKQAVVRAVNGVSFDIGRGDTLGLVGESGCGKTTVGRLILNLESVTAGKIEYAGADISLLDRPAVLALRKKIQAIFQDPFSSLNPRMSVGQIIAEPLLVFGLAESRKAARQRVAELLSQVGLYPYLSERYPHQLSGGQRQRVGIARALAMEPEFIVCDEAVSALDVSVQGQIINLLDELQSRLELTYLFIAHDLAVVRHISKRVAVMYLGRIVEIADRDDLYQNPKHPYTRALLDAAPIPDPVTERVRAAKLLHGELPSVLKPPSGCVFSSRCPMASAECRQEPPQVRDLGAQHLVACHKV
jgi:peptide/nickel transport system ATP-binding protein